MTETSRNLQNSPTTCLFGPSYKEENSDFEFRSVHGESLKNLGEKKQWKADFRGISMIFELRTTENGYSTRVYCMPENLSRLWKVSADVCFQQDTPTTVTHGNEQFRHVDFDSEHNFYEENREGSIGGDFLFVEFKIRILNVSGLVLAPILNFEKPQNGFYDTVLVVKGRKVFVQKQLLSLYSPYFHTLFTSSNPPNSEFSIDDSQIKFTEFIDFLHHIYPDFSSAHSLVTSRNVESLLRMSQRFDCSLVAFKAEQWLMDVKWMGPAWKLIMSERYGLAGLQNYVIQNLETQAEIQKISKSEYYSSMSDATKTSLLSRMFIILEKDSEDVTTDSEDSHMCRCNAREASGASGAPGAREDVRGIRRRDDGPPSGASMAGLGAREGLGGKRRRPNDDDGAEDDSDEEMEEQQYSRIFDTIVMD
ncbi:hypothetical protein L5515_012523 [Caenorhabditis briggsae]|uniref:BTB domain-containing protein n=2 Tax=Caenorhabditis briggsae TaxID=6238 RepID=A0AAE9EXU8_CAEBR|nr:hypothetical protein L5515_012523 [Caenorhabditis briggsae]